MSSRVIWLCALLVLVVAASGWLHLHGYARPAAAYEPTLEDSKTRTLRSAHHSLGPNATTRATVPAASAVRFAAQPAKVEQATEIGLQVDAQGHLLKNSQTRDELERILEGDPDGIAARRQEFIDLLPPNAAQEAADLLDRFVNYRAALRQAMPDTAGSLTQQDALILLDVTHNLRVAYFGQELTEAFFGAEEAIGRGTAEGILKAGSNAR